MKIKKTIYDKALKELQTLKEKRCFDFSLGDKGYTHKFLSKEPRPVISSVELPKPELAILFLEKLLKIFNTLTENIDKIEDKEFELLYAYFKLIINEIDFFPELRNIEGNIKDKKYIEEIKNGFQIIKLRLKSESLSFPDEVKLKDIRPINQTLEMFEILDDLIADFSDNYKFTENPAVVFKSGEKYLRYGEIFHPFQRYRDNNTAYNLLLSLWDYRKIISYDEREKSRDGQTRSKKQIALDIGLSNYLGDYENKLKIKTSLRDAIKTLRRIFKEKKFPIKLETVNKEQLIIVVKYK